MKIKVSIFWAFLNILIAGTLFTSCGGADSLSLKNSKIEGELANYIEFNGDKANVTIEYVEVESGASMTFYGLRTILTVKVPIKIKKQFPPYEPEKSLDLRNLIPTAITATCNLPTGRWLPLSSAGGVVIEGFDREEAEAFETLFSSSAGTTGELLLKYVVYSQVGDGAKDGDKIKKVKKEGEQLLKDICQGDLVIVDPNLDQYVELMNNSQSSDSSQEMMDDSSVEKETPSYFAFREGANTFSGQFIYDNSVVTYKIIITYDEMNKTISDAEYQNSDTGNTIQISTLSISPDQTKIELSGDDLQINTERTSDGSYQGTMALEGNTGTTKLFFDR